MQSKSFVLLAQLIITGMMTAMMTAIFTVMHFGLTPESLRVWGSTFLVNWPLAFGLSTVIAPLGVKITLLLVNKRAAG